MSNSPYPPVAQVIRPEGRRKVRRIIAEDLDWSLAIVPYLSKLCLQSIIENFEGMLLHNHFIPCIIYLYSIHVT